MYMYIYIYIYIYIYTGPDKTKLGLMLQRKKGLFIFGIGACAFDTHRTCALRPTKEL
jgi:hypothetical protein